MKRLRRVLVRAFQNEESKLYFSLNNFIALAILASVVTVIFETVPSFTASYADIFYTLEWIFLVIFGVEYALRIYTAKDKRGYVLSPIGILDLAALLPSLALLGLPLQSLAILWVLRLLRILRLLRTIRLVRFIAPDARTRSRLGKFVHEIQWINIEIYLFALLLVVVFSATLMFVAEGHIPGTHFPTIPDGMWWAIVTITTVGYGDMVPLTVMGKVIAGLTMICGLALFALMLVVVGHAAQRALFGSEVGPTGS